VFRRIGFKRKEVPVAAGDATADVQLEQDILQPRSRRSHGPTDRHFPREPATSSTVVTGAEITSVPAPAVDRALQGRVPGAYIEQNSAHRARTQIQIRGSNNRKSDRRTPLFVVDGVIYSDASIRPAVHRDGERKSAVDPQRRREAGRLGQPAHRSQPNDIASIDILRGAAASSIYGSKGVTVS